MVGAGEVNYYFLRVDPHILNILANNALSMDIHPYEGNPDLYITPPPRPASLE